MVAGEARKVSRFRKCFDASKLPRLADGFIVGEKERRRKDNFWVFGLSNWVRQRKLEGASSEGIIGQVPNKHPMEMMRQLLHNMSRGFRGRSGRGRYIGWSLVERWYLHAGLDEPQGMLMGKLEPWPESWALSHLEIRKRTRSKQGEWEREAAEEAGKLGQ